MIQIVSLQFVVYIQRSGVGTGGPGGQWPLNIEYQPTLPELDRCFNQSIDKDKA